MKKRNFDHYLLVLALAISGFLQAQTNLGKYGFNGSVSAIVKAPDGSTYVGGGFSTVGPYCGTGLSMDANTGAWDETDVKIEGEIFCVVAIPTIYGGGWYIGGETFTINGQSRSYLARINSDGTLHPFNPGIDDYVNALALDGNGNLYVGGDFTWVDASNRNHLAKFDNTGALTSFQPSLNGPVTALEFDGNGNLYVGGIFTTINGATRNYFAQFNTAGFLTSFNPSINDVVMDIKFDNSGNLYLAGWFFLVNGAARDGIAKFNSTGALTSFNPAVTGNINSLALDLSGNLYVGGAFSAINGLTRNRIAKFDSTGNLTSFDPNLAGEPFNFIVNSIATDGAGSLYVGGEFTNVGGSIRNRLAKFDSSGTLLSFNPNMSGNVRALAVDASGQLFVGGNFTIAGGATRNRLAKFDNMGELSSFNPNISGASVYTLALDFLGNLFVGGWFNSVGGISRNNLAKFNAFGALTSFNPNVNNSVRSLVVDDFGNLYLGGFFTSVGGVTRNRLAHFNFAGVLTSFSPNINGVVKALELDSNGNLYVGGDFTTVDGITRNRLAKFDNSGQLTSFNPGMNNSVNDLALDTGGNLYVVGSFTEVGGTASRQRLAKFDNAGVLTNFSRSVNSAIETIAFDASGNFFLGGNFSVVAGHTRNGIAMFNNAGVITSFNPNLQYIVASLVVDGSGFLHAGGSFPFRYGYFCISPSLSSVLNGANCGPGIVILEATAFSGATINWYANSVGGVPLSTGTTFTTPFLSTTTTYYVEVDNGTCVSDVRTPVVATIGLSTPNAPFGPANQTVCPNSTLADLFIVGVGIKWYDAAIGGNLLSETDALVNASDYFASQTVNGCESTNRLQVLVSITHIDETITNNSPTLSSNANGATYQWIDCINGFAPIFGETNQSFTATVNGSYAVVVTQNGCSDTSSCVLVNNVGIEDNQANAYNLSVFPNPSDGLFVIEYDYAAPVQIEVMTTDGKLVLKQELTERSNLLDLSHLPKGIYYLHLTFGNSQKTTMRVILR